MKLPDKKVGENNETKTSLFIYVLISACSAGNSSGMGVVSQKEHFQPVRIPQSRFHSWRAERPSGPGRIRRNGSVPARQNGTTMDIRMGVRTKEP